MSAPGPSMHCAIDYSGEVRKGSKCVRILGPKTTQGRKDWFWLRALKGSSLPCQGRHGGWSRKLRDHTWESTARENRKWVPGCETSKPTPRNVLPLSRLDLLNVP